jgi:acyl-ACP thioesterase
LEQTYLDLGQKSFAKRSICNTCGMLYVHGLNEDSQQHSRICMDYIKGVPFTVSQARLVSSYLKGSIVEVSRDIKKEFPTRRYHLDSNL